MRTNTDAQEKTTLVSCTMRSPDTSEEAVGNFLWRGHANLYRSYVDSPDVLPTPENEEDGPKDDLYETCDKSLQVALAKL